uniref:Uncharacterized protein n=1 Tax=Arundo donax TaxID=35708 RepID=A0A0A8YGT5_ARUDO
MLPILINILCYFR